jgi:effector-binding domain-containing protein
MYRGLIAHRTEGRMIDVNVQTVSARKLAAIRRRVKVGSVATAWRPALDQVWAFLRARPGLHNGGHNVFVYHHPRSGESEMDVEFGVEVLRSFDPTDEVALTETPAGHVAVAVHVGGYDQLRVTHDAIRAWCARERRVLAGSSWEVYGDWSDDPSQLETTVYYLLA